jgi:hypothetical protein
MILGKNKTLQKQYQSDCYDRDEFFNILSIIDIINHRKSDSGQKETFSDFSIKNDSLDFTIHNIFYPLPLVKEIFIKNWAGGWSSDQSFIHLEYFSTHALYAAKWRMKRVLKYSKLTPGGTGNPEEVAKPQTAAESAIKFIMGYKGDWSNVKKLTKFINGGDIGEKDRAKHFEAYLQDPTITQFETTTKPTSGGYVAQASTEVASGQRQQQKPSTPVVINTTTVNNTAINKNVSTVTAAKENTGNKLASRVA